MSTVMLTLHYPKGMKGVPIATSTDREVLRHFKCAVLQEWQRRIEASGDKGEVLLYRLEYQRLRSALDIFIPEETGSNEGQGRNHRC